MRRAARNAFLLTLCLLLLPFGAFAATDEPPLLTKEQKAYVTAHPEARLCVLAGTAPIAYLDDGKIQGIAGDVLAYITRATGMRFTCVEAKDSAAVVELAESGAIDAIAAIPSQYIVSSLSGYTASAPYLSASTDLFIREGLDASLLDSYAYALVEGGKPPQGVNAERVKTFATREAALNAVDRGAADYCYANEFSIAYYTIRNGYKNAISIPQGKETHDYRMLYINGDADFIDIMNLGLASVSAEDMQSAILSEISKVERGFSLSLLLYSYGGEIAALTVMLTLVLVLLLTFTLLAARQTRKQLRRYMLLAEISDEFIYEYDCARDRLTLTPKCAQLLAAPQSIERYRAGGEPLRMSDGDDLIDGDEREIELLDRGVYRVVNSSVAAKYGRTEYIIGKLVDVSEEKARMRELVVKAETDGLTGLYNPTATRSLIRKRYEERADCAAALFIFDLDAFKNINDTYGHYAGDRALTGFARALRETFRESDIVGRIGGDEFCAYMDGSITLELIATRCETLRAKLAKLGMDGLCPAVTASIGVLLCEGRALGFDEAYRRADAALYAIKQSTHDGFRVVRDTDEPSA